MYTNAQETPTVTDPPLPLIAAGDFGKRKRMVKQSVLYVALL
jgi:hypothetical protein